MADNSYDDEIALLYSEIVNRLRDGKPLDDIDEEELIDVYDYAYDMSDEFVTEEIMSFVLRRDSRCVAMLERKAMRYFQLNDLQGASAVAGLLPDDSFIRRLLSVHVSWSEADWRDGYRRLFSGISQGGLSEYDAVCLIDFALGADDISHLSRIVPRIIPLMRDPAAFLADLGGTLVDNGRYAEAIEAFQELADIEPFNLSNWIQIADVSLNNLDDAEEAASALDYALALDPESLAALRLKGELLLHNGGDGEEIMAIADRLAETEAYHAEGIYLKAGMYINRDCPAEALELLKEYIGLCGNPLDISLLMMSLNGYRLPDGIEKFIIGYLSTADVSEIQAWIDKAKVMSGTEMFSYVVSLVVSSGAELSSELIGLWLLSLYREGRFEDVISESDRFFKDTEKVPATAMLICNMARLRLGRNDCISQQAMHDIMGSAIMAYKNQGPEAEIIKNGIVRLCLGMLSYAQSTPAGEINVPGLDAIDPFK